MDPVEQDRIRRAAFNITGTFEGGRGYGNYQTYDAGIISYGRFQFTLAAGSLGRVLDNYLTTPASDTAHALMAYQARVRARDTSLRYDETFKALMIKAADEDAMKNAQDQVVIASYWAPAQDSANIRGIVTPLGQALLFDMAIQHGPAHKHTQNAETRLGVAPKSKLGENGLTEEQLITEVAKVRQEFLYGFAATNNLPGVKKRADFWVDLTVRGDWQLQGDTDGNVFVYSKPVQVRNPAGAGSSGATLPATPTAPAAPAMPATPVVAPPVAAGAGLPGNPVRGTYLTNQILTVRDAPNINANKLGRVRQGRLMPVTRQYIVSPTEEWLQTDVGWIARRHPDYPGEEFGQMTLM
jgi:hypothetical protein